MKKRERLDQLFCQVFFHKFPKSYGRKRAIVDSPNLIKFMAALMLPSAKKKKKDTKKESSELVFCYQNCFDLHTVRKNYSCDRERPLKLEAEGREFAKFLR